MKFRIHFVVDNVEDSVVVEGETVQDVREKAEDEVTSRGGTDAWSEEIS